MKTSVVIPNWNGKELLEKNLPKVLAIEASEVIIVENGSTDGSFEYLENLKSQISNLKVIKNETNLGFARGVNQGVKTATGDVVVLLNTDVVPQKDLLKHVLPHFENPEVFAVSFNEQNWSWAKGYFKNGLIEHLPGEKYNETHISFWASGGSAAFDRKKWLELGGFNLIYEPFYWEDIDISYRAQKRGWIVLWEPKAIVDHEHELTVRKHGDSFRKDLISQRNQLLFFWCNISSIKMWVFHIFWLLIRMLKPGYWRILFMAKLKVFEAVLFRFRQGRSKISDEEILAKFTN